MEQPLEHLLGGYILGQGGNAHGEDTHLILKFYFCSLALSIFFTFHPH